MQESQPPEDGGQLATGWNVLAGNDSVVRMIDTLMDLPSTREFNKTELATHAEVSRKSVHTHFDLLVALDIIEAVPETSPTRYRFNPESDVSQAIMRLDSVVNRAGPEAAG